MPEICLRYSWDVMRYRVSPEMGLRNAWDIFKTSMRYRLTSGGLDIYEADSPE